MNFEEVMSTAVKIGICSYGIREYRVFICESDFFLAQEIMRTSRKFVTV